MLPFIAGAIAGVAVVVAVQKRKEIKEKMMQGAKYAQNTVNDATSDIKEKVHEMTAEENSKEEKPKEEKSKAETEVKKEENK